MTPAKVARPQAAQGVTFKEEVACNDMFTIVNGWDNHEHAEVFLKCGSQGSCTAAVMNALSVLFSIARRCGVPLLAIAKLFHRHGGSCSKAMESGTHTCVFALGQLLLGLTDGEEIETIGEPLSLDAKRKTRFTGCGPMKIWYGFDSEKNLRCLEVRLASKNTCANTITSAVADLITLMLGYGVEPGQIAHGLKGISCPAAVMDSSSCLDGIARAIEDYLNPPDPSEVISDEGASFEELEEG